ncbi:hypothetical protein JST97_35465 [bacterium]|nr:hypothetical protein [bacterium]
MRKTLCLLLLLVNLPAWGQDQAELLRNFRNSWNGYPILAEVFDRYVKVNATPDWWAFLCADRNSGYALVNLTRGLTDLGVNLGWADIKTMDEGMGGKGDAPPVLEALDSWKGKLAVTVTLPAGLDEARKTQVMSNYDLINGVVGWKAGCLPRGGQFFLNVTTSPKATEAQGKVSKDGNHYEVVLPIYASITSGQLEKIFVKGMK